jgi:drug/metabolite transporter (DMT)-like permease
MTLWYAAGFDFGRVTPGGWASLVYMAAFPSVVSYLIYYWALTHVTASRVAAFSYLQPLLATLLGVALLDEKVTGWLIAGGALVLAGVFVTERLAAKR